MFKIQLYKKEKVKSIKLNSDNKLIFKHKIKKF